jgi:hypothetical protein
MRPSLVKEFGILFLSLLILLACAAPASAQELPKGWRVPAASLTRQDFRRKDPSHFLTVIGDFDGDGVKDRAVLLVTEKSTQMAFFVCLSTPNGCNWHRLEVMEIEFLDVMGIAKVPSGKYETACGKGYWECEKDEPKLLVTKRAAIEFLKDESASSVYVYDPKKRAFKAIATSD